MPHEQRDIVCFANDWSGDPLSKKHVMRRLARHHRVLWVSSLGNRAPRASAHDLKRMFDKLRKFTGGLFEAEHNIHVLSPLAVPAYRSPLMRRINQVLVGATVRGAMRQLAFRRPLVYTFVPASAWVARELGAERLIYHCVDDFSQFDGAGDAIAGLEDELCRASDLVITCSVPLATAKRRLNANTVLIRHGVEQAHFARALDLSTEVPADVRDLPRPILGFYGLLAEWVDLAVLRQLALAWPAGSVVIVGEVNHAERHGLAELRALPNVHLLGHRPYAVLPNYCKAFDLALLPFVKNQLTENANPLKLREYLAAGLRVVSTNIPEAAALADHGVHLADNPDQFVEQVRRALSEGAGCDRARSQAMALESWDHKVAEIEARLLRL